MELNKEISKELDVGVKFEGGKLVLSTDYQGHIGGAKLELSVSAAMVIDAITKAIPGTIDNTVGELLKAGLVKL